MFVKACPCENAAIVFHDPIPAFKTYLKEIAPFDLDTFGG